MSRRLVLRKAELWAQSNHVTVREGRGRDWLEQGQEREWSGSPSMVYGCSGHLLVRGNLKGGC